MPKRSSYTVDLVTEFTGPMTGVGLRYQVAKALITLGSRLMRSTLVISPLTTHESEKLKKSFQDAAIRNQGRMTVANSPKMQMQWWGACEFCHRTGDLTELKGSFLCGECLRQRMPLEDLTEHGADVGLGLRKGSPEPEPEGIPATPSRPSRVSSLRDRLRRLLGR